MKLSEERKQELNRVPLQLFFVEAWVLLCLALGITAKSAPNMKTPFRYYFKKHWRVFSLGVASLFMTNLFDCLYPLAIKNLIDLVEAGHFGHELWPTVAVFLAMMAAVAFFRFAWRIFFGRFQHEVADELRGRVFRKLTTMGASFYQKNPVGQLMSLITNDINSFRMALGGGVLVLLDAVFLIAIIIPLMLYLSVGWTWRTLIFLPLLPPLIQRIEHLIHERYKLQQERFAELSGVAQEVVSGVRVIKSYAQEPAQSDHFNLFSRNFELACNRSAQVDSLFQPCMEFAVALGSVILLWVGSPDVVNGAVTIGTFFAFHRYINKMIWPMTAIGIGVTMVQQGRASIERVVELLETPTDIPDNGTIILGEFEQLEVRHLTFTYPGSEQAVLHDLSFRLSRGQTLGIVGHVGAGKSTLLQLLGRLYPVPRGMIWINGHDINDIRLDSLRATLAMVPQDSFLFSETVADNIKLGVDGAEELETVRRFARQVQIDDEMTALNEAYDSYLGERGVNLSGGQKQRLTMARAFIRQAQVVVLDDSLSAVDTQTEKSIMSHLAGTNRQTRIIVSHRLRALESAEVILVLHQGRIEASGSAEELLISSPVYLQLAQLQREHEARGDKDVRGPIS